MAAVFDKMTTEELKTLKKINQEYIEILKQEDEMDFWW